MPFTATSTWTWIDHPVSGLLRLTFALFRLGFPSAPHLQCLTSPASVTRRTVLQKVRGSSYKDVPQLVNTGFQVLFHSPPGVLFTFPSQYYTLSVTGEYLGLEGGPPIFPPGFTCPVVLWIQPAVFPFRIRDYHSLWWAVPCPSARVQHALRCPNPGHISTAGLASSAFARHYLRNLG